MRNWHRRLSIYIGIFMFVIAVSGVALQFEMMSNGPKNTASANQPVPRSDADLQKMFSASLAGMRHDSRSPILGVDMRINGTHPFTEFVVADRGIRKILVDAKTGEIVGGKTSRNDASDWHLFLLELHRGSMAGTTGLWISITCGIVLGILSVTGLGLYIQMYLRRRHNKPGFFW